VPDFPVEEEKKNALRLRILAARHRLSAADRDSAAALLQAAAIRAVRRVSATVIAAYLPVGDEPGGSDLADVLVAELPAGGRLLLPVLLPDLDLDWAAYAGAAWLTAGRFGLREPAGPRLGVSSITTADLVIVPALAADPRGNRLGRGGGSYDRALARVSTSRTIALLHDGELLDDVPVGPLDRPIAAVITPADGFRPLVGWTK
jgi:5-formyltetrahydrofolate cyclo-ligase